MFRPSFLFLLAPLALLPLAACSYDNWDNTPPKNEIPGGWDDIRFHNHDLGHNTLPSYTPPGVVTSGDHDHTFVTPSTL